MARSASDGELAERRDTALAFRSARHVDAGANADALDASARAGDVSTMPTRSLALSLAGLLVACGPIAPTVDAATTDGAQTTATADAPTTAGFSSMPGIGSDGTAAGTTGLADTTTSTSDPEPASTGDPPAPAPDLGAPVACDLWAQDCPPGQKCTFGSSQPNLCDLKQCVTVVDDPLPLGAPCTPPPDLCGPDDCELGALCTPLWIDGDPVCHPLCGGSAEAPICALGFTCLPAGDLGVCAPTCDPVAQTCPEEQACYVLPGGAACAPEEGLHEQLYEECDPNWLNGCAQGLLCVPSGAALECGLQGGHCCVPMCDVDAVNMCTGKDQTCAPLYTDEPAPFGLEHVGFCSHAP